MSILSDISTGEAATVLGSGGLALLFARKLIKSWFTDKKEAVMDGAETNLYATLVSENTRMAERIELLTQQVQILITQNNSLKDEVAEVNRKLEASNDWEQTAKHLQEELTQRDVYIAKISRQGDKALTKEGAV